MKKVDQNSNYLRGPAVPAAGSGPSWDSERVRSDPNLTESFQNNRKSGGLISMQKKRPSAFQPPIQIQPLTRIRNAPEDLKRVYSSHPEIYNENPAGKIPPYSSTNLYENYENLDTHSRVQNGVLLHRYVQKPRAAPPPVYSVNRRPASSVDPVKLSPIRRVGSPRHMVPVPITDSVPRNPEGSKTGVMENVHFEVATVVPPAAERENGDGEMIRWRNKSNLTVVTDQRRHTVSEGVIDSHMTKHEKILMEEKDIVQRGLEVANRLRNWYHERLATLETRQKYVSKGMVPVDYAVHEQKLNYLRAHVTEVNRRMTSLIESSEKSFPSFVNYEKQGNILQPADDQVLWMKKQNQALTDEVGEKTSRIQELEKELSSLRRQYVQSRTAEAARLRRSNSPALSSSRSSQGSSLNYVTRFEKSEDIIKTGGKF